MEKIVVSIVGADRPGIVAAISKILLDFECNIEDVSQTILQNEFAAIYIVSCPEGLDLDELQQKFEQKLSSQDLNFMVKQMRTKEKELQPINHDPFVITAIGADRLGLVAGISEIMARFGVNITSLKAAFRGGDDPSRNTMIFQVEIPGSTDQKAFRRSLRERAESLGLDLSMQHRDIFEAINRV